MATCTLKDKSNRIIPAGEVGAFSVCPRAWKLKCVDGVIQDDPVQESLDGIVLHRTWAKRYDEAMNLTRNVRLVVALICAAVTIFLLVRSQQIARWEWLSDYRSTELLELVPLVLLGLFVAEIVHRAARTQKEESGLGAKQETVSLDGSTASPVRDYVSIRQRIAGRPDAVITEASFRIPVERKPLAKKLRDRYVAQILMYMRLIEEFEGAKPPYGYLILGPKCRRVKVENSAEKQRWVDALLSQMRSILAGKEAHAAVHPKKCGSCDVRKFCAEGTELVRIETARRAEKSAVTQSGGVS